MANKGNPGGAPPGSGSKGKGGSTGAGTGSGQGSIERGGGSKGPTDGVSKVGGGGRENPSPAPVRKESDK